MVCKHFTSLQTFDNLLFNYDDHRGTMAMGERFIDLLFPAACLLSSVVIAMGSVGLEDKEARNQGLTYAGTMLTISGATYQVNVKNRGRD